MAEPLRHLLLPRLAPVNPRRTRQPPHRPAPDDPRAHAHRLAQDLEAQIDSASRETGAFDPRLLLKLEVEGIQPEDLEAIPGLRLVSQEGKSLIVLFADESGLFEFQDRLAQVASGRTAVRQDVLFAIKGVDGWSPEDRQGPALRREGLPSTQPCTVDVELWPLENLEDRRRMLLAFQEWNRARGISWLDHLSQETIVLCRLLLSQENLDEILLHRDVRQVDLPPRYQFDFTLLGLDLSVLPEVSSPSEDAPGIVVLDSGLTTNHPLLAPAIGDVQSFLPGLGAEDEHGHGTMVGGLALYGDLETLAKSQNFAPVLRVFGGRITDATNENSTGFVERQIEEAVRYFNSSYGCRIFNLSFGDARKPFEDGHVRGLAAVLDSLARKYAVLFVVAAGNFNGTAEFPADWRAEYPDYLFKEPARILDPAPALNALTVGSLARHEIPRMSQRHPNDPGYQAIARRNEPSPFSRSGPGPNGAIKPEVVEYGGNQYVELRSGPSQVRGLAELGELGPSMEFAGGRLFSIGSGTSYAAPKVAHLAARLLAEYPEASPNLLRALIVAHSRCPDEAIERIGDEDKARKLLGYGQPDGTSTIFSSERRVSLIHEAVLGENQHHFFEVPLPEDFLRPPARRTRRITVALAHTPHVRRTRIDYRASSFEFRIVRKRNLAEVVKVFKRTPQDERERLIPEFAHFRPTAQQRKKGTVQAASCEFNQVDSRWTGQSLFLVVTRAVPTWALGLSDQEGYALVVVVEDGSTEQVRYYSQILQRIRPQVRL